MFQTRLGGVKHALVLVAALAIAPAGAWAQEATFERTFEISGPVTLDAETSSGSITVTGAEGRAVVVRGHVRVNRGIRGGDAADVRAVEQNPPVFHEGNTVRVRMPEDEDLRRAVSISYEIRVPRDTAVSARSGSGSVSVDNVARTVTASTGSGSIRVNGAGGTTQARTGSGSIELASIGGDAEVSTGSGAITLQAVKGAVKAQTGSGSIRASLEGTGAASASTGSGTITLEGVRNAVEARSGSGSISVNGTPGGPWNVSAGSGSVTLAIPQAANFQLSARAGSGRVEVGRPLAMESWSSNRRELKATIGSGGPLVEVRTASGSIRVQ